MRGARIFDIAKQLIQQPRLQDTITQATTTKQRRMHINADKVFTDGVDVESPALKRRQFSPSGSHTMQLGDEYEDEEDGLVPSVPAPTLVSAFAQAMSDATAAKGQKFLPVAGNMYRYWAMNGNVFNWEKDADETLCKKGSRLRKTFGMLLLLLIQLVAPSAVIVATIYKIQWHEVQWWESDPWYIHHNQEYGVSWFTSRILGLGFIAAYSLWALDRIESEKSDWLKLNSLLNIYERSQEENGFWSNTFCGWSTTRFFLWLGPAVNCLTFLGCAVAMLLLLKVADSPKDVVFDSLSLLFLLQLDDLDSDLGFLDEDDWDQKGMGQFVYECIMLPNAIADPFFADDVKFPDGDPRVVQDPDPEFDLNVDDPATLVATGVTKNHPCYSFTRVALHCVFFFALVFWLGVKNVKMADEPDIAVLKTDLAALQTRLVALER